MQTQNLIFGLNPLVISRVEAVGFKRLGKHPRYYKIKWWKTRDIFDGVYYASVNVYGADGNLIKHIVCRSNQHAEHVRDQILAHVNEIIETLKVK